MNSHLLLFILHCIDKIDIIIHISTIHYDKQVGVIMNDRKTDYKKILRQMIIRYIVAVSALIILIIARQTIISYELYHNDHISSVINTAGRQRMLSQKISKDVLMIYTLNDNITIQGYVRDQELSVCLGRESEQIKKRQGRRRSGNK